MLPTTCGTVTYANCPAAYAIAASEARQQLFTSAWNALQILVVDLCNQKLQPSAGIPNWFGSELMLSAKGDRLFAIGGATGTTPVEDQSLLVFQTDNLSAPPASYAFPAGTLPFAGWSVLCGGTLASPDGRFVFALAGDTATLNVVVVCFDTQAGIGTAGVVVCTTTFPYTNNTPCLCVTRDAARLYLASGTNVGYFDVPNPPNSVPSTPPVATAVAWPGTPLAITFMAATLGGVVVGVANDTNFDLSVVTIDPTSNSSNPPTVTAYSVPAPVTAAGAPSGGGVEGDATFYFVAAGDAEGVGTRLVAFDLQNQTFAWSGSLSSANKQGQVAPGGQRKCAGGFHSFYFALDYVMQLTPVSGSPFTTP